MTINIQASCPFLKNLDPNDLKDLYVFINNNYVEKESHLKIKVSLEVEIQALASIIKNQEDEITDLEDQMLNIKAEYGIG